MSVEHGLDTADLADVLAAIHDRIAEIEELVAGIPGLDWAAMARPDLVRLLGDLDQTHSHLADVAEC